LSLAAAALTLTTLLPALAAADPWDVRREVAEGARNVQQERREAAREIDRCRTRDCVQREVIEGRREVQRERYEAAREIHRERHVDGFERVQRSFPPGRPGNYGYGYGRPWYYNDAHYHPNGRHCTDGRHLVHYRDGYYRGDRRWYRDHRYWDENAYVSRYYRPRDRYDRYDRDDDDGNDDLLRGLAIGAATVGVIAAIHEAND
jgi:hypothetical protein